MYTSFEVHILLFFLFVRSLWFSFPSSCVSSHRFAAPCDGLAGPPGAVGGKHQLRLPFQCEQLPQGEGDTAAPVRLVLEHLYKQRLSHRKIKGITPIRIGCSKNNRAQDTLLCIPTMFITPQQTRHCTHSCSNNRETGQALQCFQRAQPLASHDSPALRQMYTCSYRSLVK